MASTVGTSLTQRPAPRSERLVAQGLCELFQRTAAEHCDAVALRSVDGSTVLTWRDYASSVRGLAGLGSAAAAP